MHTINTVAPFHAERDSDIIGVINRTIIGTARIACLCPTVVTARENTLQIFNTRIYPLKK